MRWDDAALLADLGSLWLLGFDRLQRNFRDTSLHWWAMRGRYLRSRAISMFWQHAASLQLGTHRMG